MAKKILIYRMVLLALFLIGSGAVAGGVWWMSEIQRIDKEYVSTKAKIEKIEKYTQRRGSGKSRRQTRVIVSYLANDKVYTQALGAYNSSMHEGDSIQLKYNPREVTEIRSTEVEYNISIGMIIGGVILLISDLFMPKLFRKLKFIE